MSQVQALATAIGAISAAVGALAGVWFTRVKTVAEVSRIRSENQRDRAEIEQIKSEIHHQTQADAVAWIERQSSRIADLEGQLDRVRERLSEVTRWIGVDVAEWQRQIEVQMSAHGMDVPPMPPPPRIGVG